MRTFSSQFYLDVKLEPGAQLVLPTAFDERALYLIDGALVGEGTTITPRRMIVLEKDATPILRADIATHLVMLGGQRLDGERNIWWNFVSSSLERIERAKRDWNEDRFPKVPGDDAERIPLPDR